MNVARIAIAAMYNPDVKVPECAAERHSGRERHGRHIWRSAVTAGDVWRRCDAPDPEIARVAPSVCRIYQEDAFSLILAGGLTRKQRRRLWRAIRRRKVSRLQRAIRAAA